MKKSYIIEQEIASCAECENRVLPYCDGCDKYILDRDRIYCDNAAHFCEECAEEITEIERTHKYGTKKNKKKNKKRRKK